MTATLRAPANDILNRVAAEVGLDPVADPWGSQQQEFRQMRYLLNIAGEELSQLYPWEFLTVEHAVVTQAGDSGDYDLPPDFLYMINQTGWERAENVPLAGPLTPQSWQWLKGRDLAGHAVYASFRIKRGQFSMFPSPPPAGMDVHFEYVSRNWVIDSTITTAERYIDRVKVGADTPLFDRTLISRMVKVKFLEAKGMDTTKAQADFNQAFQMVTAHDKGAQIIRAGRGVRDFPYLDARLNVPDSGYGH